ncbi:MAG TPA: MlaD family protein [Acidimicrobiales bacterium]|nr:MlaD family protein [Acidimicrobiales bacterium]
MRTTRAARRAALLALAALVASSCALPGNITGSREVTAVFDDVGDLVVGHSVQVADVRIGSVVGIELTDDYDARVTLSIKDDLFVPVESLALLRTTSLLGEKFIELRPLDEDDPMAGTNLRDGDVLSRTAEAPELEFVTEQAVEILGAVVSTDVATIVETGAIGFGDRAVELTSLVEDLTTVSGTLADQTDEIVRIIDAMGAASSTFAAGSDEIGELLANLADTAQVLAQNRDVALGSIRELTRLARVQNENILGPYLTQVDAQIEQVDAILAEVDRNQGQVAELLRWVAQFAVKIPKGVPDGFAQVYGLLQVVE